MPEEKKEIDENFQQLIRSSLGKDAIPDQQMYRKTHAVLQRLQADRHPAEFPLPVLIALAGLFLFSAVWLFFKVSQPGIMDATAWVNAIFIGANLAFIPLASLTIITIRRIYDK